MNTPDLYLKQLKITKNGSESIARTYFQLLQKRDKDEAMVLDIGCGPGHITHDVILPLFNYQVCKVVGVDISKEMIEYATKHFKNEKILFEMLDIVMDVPQKYLSCFDFVFSFLALQWIKDQRKLFSNIHKMLKSNGEILVSYIVTTNIYVAYHVVGSKPQFAPHIGDLHVATSVFHYSKDPKKELRNLLEDIGFEVCMIEIKRIESERVVPADFKEFLISINPFYSNIPDDLKVEFIDDIMLELSRQDVTNTSESYSLVMHNFVVYARKK